MLLLRAEITHDVVRKVGSSSRVTVTKEVSFFDVALMYLMTFYVHLRRGRALGERVKLVEAICKLRRVSVLTLPTFTQISRSPRT